MQAPAATVNATGEFSWGRNIEDTSIVTAAKASRNLNGDSFSWWGNDTLGGGSYPAINRKSPNLYEHLYSPQVVAEN